MTDSERSSESEGEARALESTGESVKNSEIVQPEAETNNIKSAICRNTIYQNIFNQGIQETCNDRLLFVFKMK